MAKYFKQAGIFLLILSVVGCTSAGITTRSYVEDKERVDQEMAGGNMGYIQGQPKPEDRSEYKKTRKVYVLEFTKETGEPEIEPVVITRTKVETVPVEAPSKPALPNWAQPVQIPKIEEEMEPATGPGTMVDYEVQKFHLQ